MLTQETKYQRNNNKNQHVQLNQITLINQNPQIQNTLDLYQITQSNIVDIERNKIKNQDDKKNHSYRPDIDGLRAIAVGIVVIFHAWPQIMTGGFIGVDIFFVISGFLISGIIIKQIKNKQFSYFNFYSRRVKRIFPSLILVLICVFIFAYKILTKRQYQIVTHTIESATVFGANIEVLTYQKGYFDPDIKTNALLHLWSLGVQEQFYIIWPCVISIVVNTFKDKGLYVLIIFTFISFTFSIFSIYGINQKFAFYFPFCRFWQMSIGGIIAYQNLKIKSQLIINILSSLSTVTILITIWFLNQQSLFPGFWALIPGISAASIILAGKQSMINKYVLSSKLFVFIGKISYPLYLWHWPLLVYSRVMFPQGSTAVFSNPLTIVILSLILSILTYFLVQRPLRYRKNKKIVYLLVVLMLIIGLSGVLIQRREDLLEPIDEQKQRIQEQNLRQIQTARKIQEQLDKIQKQQKQKEKILIQEQQKKQKQKQNEQRNKQIQQKYKEVEVERIRRQKELQELRKKHQEQIKRRKQMQQQRRKKQQQLRKKLQQQDKLKPKTIPKPQPKPKPKPVNPNNQENDLLPKQDDFFYKNGKKHANSSKNKNRKRPTVDKLIYSSRFQHNQCFPTRIQPNSPYYDNYVRMNSEYFEVLNPGQQKRVFIVGDSHSQVIRYRFLQLFEEAKRQNKTSEFPTVVAMCKCGMPYYPCHPYFNASFNYIKKHKPTRVLIVNHWYLWLHYAFKDGALQKFPDCTSQFVNENRQSYRDVALVVETFKQTVKQMVDLGIQVHVATINPQGSVWNPRHMYDYNDIIQNNIKPISLVKFQAQNKQKIQMLQTAVKQAGGHILDFTDNQCWQGVCQLTTPYGHAVIRDNDHFRYQYARYWVTSVDYLTEF